MNIQEQFNLVAMEYDENRRKFIPCFDDYYVNSTKLIFANIKKPVRVLDLGAGTGLLSYYWYKQSPSSEYVLVDIANEMLEVSKKRFGGIDSVSHRVMDYTKELPTEEFDAIISALSIHHLDNDQKQSLFHDIYNKFPEGGIFVNYDQFCAGSITMDEWFNKYWESNLHTSGLTEKDIELWEERRKFDKECSVEQEMEMLKNSGFTEVKCIYSYHKFSVIVALK